MRILHITTSDTGGAGRAAYRLHRGLQHAGHQSAMLVAQRHGDDTAVWCSRNGLARVPTRLAQHLTSRGPGWEFFSDDRSKHGAELVEQLPDCDVINLHWVARFIDYQSFFSHVAASTPVVWTLHDMNPFTGGCHYSDGCHGFVEQCGACPQLESTLVDDLSHEIWQRKSDSYARIPPLNMRIVTPSQWLAGEMRRSALLGRYPVSVIPNGLDTQAFAPRDRIHAREVLGIPPQAAVVLFVAEWTDNRRKGFALLSEALARLNKRLNCFLLSLGGHPPAEVLDIPRLHLGVVGNERLLSLIYSAADVFVIPSREDNLPNTVLEAMACGTPVVGFEVGGIPEMVRPGITGLLAPPEDAAALGQAISELLQDHQGRTKMAAQCRRIAVEEYAVEIQARRYGQLYQQLCTGTQKLPQNQEYRPMALTDGG